MQSLSTEPLGHKKAVALISGASAGLCVDLTLYPLDTIKTRLQSATRAVKPSGKLKLFAGLPAVALGSAPAAALFFSVYEAGKSSALYIGAPVWLSSMIAASLGEIVACVVRVPCEVVKQRAQHRPHLSISSIISQSLKNEGIGGLYRGYLSTIFRELPFSLIQYPVWEMLKRGLERHNRRHSTTVDGRLTAGQFALCGALAGAIAGGCTTPLDVIKTRIMLAEKDTVLASGRVFSAMKVIYAEAGLSGLFAGVVQRILLLSIGGAIFLGFYDIANRFWSRKLR